MSNEPDTEEFLKVINQRSAKSMRMEELVNAFRDNTPNVTPS